MIESKYMTKEVLIKELENAKKIHSNKSKLGSIKLNFKMNELPMIPEESEKHMEME